VKHSGDISRKSEIVKYQIYLHFYTAVLAVYLINNIQNEAGTII